MTKANIYEIAVKILGIYLFTKVIESVKEVASVFATFIQYQENPERYGYINYFPFLSISIINVLLILSFAMFLTFGTKTIIKKICHQQDFDESLVLNLDKKAIYEISLSVVGLLIFVWTLTEFAFHLKNYFQSLNTSTNNVYVFYSATKLIIGLVMVFYSKSISSLIVRKSK